MWYLGTHSTRAAARHVVVRAFRTVCLVHRPSTAALRVRELRREGSRLATRDVAACSSARPLRFGSGLVSGLQRGLALARSPFLEVLRELEPVQKGNFTTTGPRQSTR